MLHTLRFVRGAVSAKDLVPILGHFCIRNGRITGYDGRIAISSPIALDLEANPRAQPFVHAITACTEEVALSLTPNGRLAVASGNFKAFIECAAEPYPDIKPTGQHVHPRGQFLGALRRLLPFVAQDASRPWAMGVLLHGHSAYATNNVVLAEHWLGVDFPVTVNVPKAAIEELLRIGEEPISLQVDDTSVTFHYEGERWLRSVLYATSWPDVTKILDRPTKNLMAIPDSLFKAIRDLKPFVEKTGHLYLCPEGPHTAQEQGTGACVNIPLWPKVLTFHIDQFLLLEGVAHWFDPAQHPHLWFGDGIRGAIAGMRA